MQGQNDLFFSNDILLPRLAGRVRFSYETWEQFFMPTRHFPKVKSRPSPGAGSSRGDIVSGGITRPAFSDVGKEELAIDGGSKVRETPFPHGSRFGPEELDYLREVLDQNRLFYFNGTMTERFKQRFCEFVGSRYVVTCSSGTGAIHTALGAAGIGVGDEVITVSITDLGTVIGILQQNAVPVFCDTLPHTYAMDVEDINRKVTPRTKAIIVVHLAGNSCDMDGIMAIADEHDLVVIEDCAQAWGALYKGRHVGTFGQFGCFSTNEFKHITTGDGGMVCMNDKKLHRRAHLFADKGYDRFDGTGVQKDPRYLCCNYRWTELQAAVGLAQLEKLQHIVDTRHRLGERLTEQISECPGMTPHTITANGWCSYWFYMFQVSEEALGVTRERFVDCVKAEGIPAESGYLSRPIYKWPLFQDETFFPNGWPVKMMGLTGMDYKQVCCPMAEEILATAVRLPIDPFMNDNDIDDMAAAINKVTLALRK